MLSSRIKAGARAVLSLLALASFCLFTSIALVRGLQRTNLVTSSTVVKTCQSGTRHTFLEKSDAAPELPSASICRLAFDSFPAITEPIRSRARVESPPVSLPPRFHRRIAHPRPADPDLFS
jgi:hypothetical protein